MTPEQKHAHQKREMALYEAMPAEIREVLKYEPLGVDMVNVTRAVNNLSQSGLSVPLIAEWLKAECQRQANARSQVNVRSQRG